MERQNKLKKLSMVFSFMSQLVKLETENNRLLQIVAWMLQI